MLSNANVNSNAIIDYGAVWCARNDFTSGACKCACVQRIGLTGAIPVIS